MCLPAWQGSPALEAVTRVAGLLSATLEGAGHRPKSIRLKGPSAASVLDADHLLLLFLQSYRPGLSYACLVGRSPYTLEANVDCAEG